MPDPDPQNPPSDPPADPTPPVEPTGNWYDTLSDPDLKNNPTLQKYASAEDAHKGHLALQQSFGKDKIVLPKDENDTEAWGKLNEFLGVPEKAEGYGLDPMKAPEGSGQEMFDRESFQNIMKEAGAPKSVAEKVWGSYTKSMGDLYGKAQADANQRAADTKSELMGEWGEAYEAKINQGQAVIDTFGKTETQRDFLTATFSQDADGRRFLAEVGAQFKESSIAGFQNKSSFTPTPKEAEAEIGKIKQGAEYNHDDIKVRQPAIDRVLELRKLIKK